MPSTYSAGVGLELPGSGEQAGVWGTTVNKNYSFLDDVLYGGVTVTLSTTPHALDISDGLACTARNGYIVFDGSPAADVTVTLGPNSYHRLFWAKNTTGKNIVFSQGSGATLTLANGASCMVFANGDGATAAVTGVNLSPQVAIVLFAQSSTPTMDGVARQWADSGGARYDGLSHKFDAYVSSARQRVMELSSLGRVLISSDVVEVTGPTGVESFVSIKKTGSASATNILWELAHQSNDKDFWLRSYNGAASKDWIKFLHDSDLACLKNGKFLVNTETSSSADLVQVNGGVKASSFTGTVELTNLPQTAATTNQGILWSGSAWAPASVVAGIGSGDITMAMIAQASATAGQAIVWSGSAWAPATLTPTGVVITKSATVPTSSGSAGDIVLNSAVTGGKHAGWICTGGTTWKKFGVVEL